MAEAEAGAGADAAWTSQIGYALIKEVTIEFQEPHKYWCCNEETGEDEECVAWIPVKETVYPQEHNLYEELFCGSKERPVRPLLLGKKASKKEKRKNWNYSHHRR